MEFIKKIIPFLTVVLVFVLKSCMLFGPAPAPDTLTLLELSPLPRQLVEKQPVSEYEPVYTILRIVEISELNGVQRSFLVRFGTDRTGIRVGVDGEIASDAACQNIIGNCKVTEINGNFFRCQIQELTHKIQPNAYVRIKTGEKIKETGS